MLSAANSRAEWNSFTTATHTSTGHSKFIATVAATKEMQSIAAPTWALIRKQRRPRMGRRQNSQYLHTNTKINMATASLHGIQLLFHE